MAGVEKGLFVQRRDASGRDGLLVACSSQCGDIGSGGRGLLFVAQFAAQDLADIGLRQVGPELDLLRDLVVRQLLVAELDDVLGGEVRVLLDDERLDGLARALVGTPITAHSSTPGWLAITSSISFG